MLTYYLAMQPQLFNAAVDDQLHRLQAEKQGADAAAASPSSATALLPPPAPPPPGPPTPHPEMADEAGAIDASADNDDDRGHKKKDDPPPPPPPSMAVLRRRIDAARAAEARATLEDLLYVSVLERFVLLGVEMLPRLDGLVDARQANLLALTEGVHSKEALELVREHLLSATGGGGGGGGGGPSGAGAAGAFSNALVKMSKLQMAQVYAASVMFGYFLRRVDRRFQMEKAFGVLGDGAGGGEAAADPPPRFGGLAGASIDSADGAAAAAATNEEAVARLEALLARAADLEVVDDPDVPTMTDEDDDDAQAASARSGRPREKKKEDDGSSKPPRDLSPTTNGTSRPNNDNRAASPRTLRAYIERFDPQTLAQTARVVSAEGAAVVERQTTALFGDVRLLTVQMRAALRSGGPVSSPSELYARIERAVSQDSVETLAMTVGAQRRVVLEAVAFGAFLRDVEDRVASEFAGLLTPMPPPPGRGGAGGMLGPGGGGGGGGGGDDDDDGDDDWRGGGGGGGGGGGNLRRRDPTLTM
jgi:uncharacterized membrane protein YgcG